MSRLPSSEDLDAIDAVLNPYFLALGKVAHAWNHMHDQLAQLFCAVTGHDNSMGLSIWHALKSDRSQRDLLDAAIKSANLDEDWVKRFPKAKADIIWLLNEVQKVANRRNDAIHAPCYALPEADDFEIKPVAFFRNPRAKKLLGKDILAEFAWYENSADALKIHAQRIQMALLADGGPWPERPLLPTLG